MIAMQMKWEGVTPEQYHELNNILNITEVPPEGLQIHIAFSDGNNLRVQDVWESQEYLNAFSEHRLMPAVMQLGITAQPQMEIYPVISLKTPGFVSTSDVEMDEEVEMEEELEPAA